MERIVVGVDIEAEHETGSKVAQSALEGGREHDSRSPVRVSCDRDVIAPLQPRRRLALLMRGD